MSREYIHGYTQKEQNRLLDQGDILEEFVFDGMSFSGIKTLLEVGSGVGAQTGILLQRYPDLHITCLEIEPKQIEVAKRHLVSLGIDENRYTFIQGNAAEVELDDRYDAALFIWVLEHVENPYKVLFNIKKFVNQSGKIFAVEVMHDSLQLFPACPHSMDYWNKGIEYQKSIKGDANIGLRLGNIFQDVGFRDLEICPYPIHLGKHRRETRGKMLEYWHGLMKSALENMLKANYITEAEWERTEAEIRALQQNDEAVFYYSFIRGIATI